MLSLLKKYRQWLAYFFAGLLCVVFSSVVFAEKAPAFDNVVKTQKQTSFENNYDFPASHQEPNFYQ
jgi:hypothetical protein